jgi:hypothetical protein
MRRERQSGKAGVFGEASSVKQSSSSEQPEGTTTSTTAVDVDGGGEGEGGRSGSQ